MGGSTLTSDGEEMPASSMVQVFDVNSGLTLMATPLPVAAPDVRSVMVDRKIYVITGKSLFVMEDEEDAEEEQTKLEETVDDVELTVIDAAAARQDSVDHVPRAVMQLEAALAALHPESSASTTSAIVADAPSLPETFPVPIRSSTPPITVDVKWKQLASIPNTTSHTTLMTTASALLDNIYLFGGFRNRHVYVYNTVSGRWDTGETVGDELGMIRPVGSACIIAPTQVFALEQCRSPRVGSIKVIPKRKKKV